MSALRGKSCVLDKESEPPGRPSPKRTIGGTDPAATVYADTLLRLVSGDQPGFLDDVRLWLQQALALESKLGDSGGEGGEAGADL